MRHPHADDAGHRLTVRTGPLLPNGKRGYVTVYLAEEQGIPESDGGKWAIVCQAHSTLLQVATLSQARSVARAGSDEFCYCCRGNCFPADGWEICPTCGAGGGARTT